MSLGDCSDDAPVTRDPELARAISSAMVKLYAAFYSHDRTTATTYINDKVVVCILENILSESEDEFTAEVERLTDRHVVAFLSVNQTTSGVACELFFLDAAPDPANV